MKDDIKTMIQKVVQGKFIEAQEASSRILANKALQKMDELKVKVAKDFYNKEQG